MAVSKSRFKSLARSPWQFERKFMRGSSPRAALRRPLSFISIECCNFSGATLLAFLLNTHPDVASIGEMTGLIKMENPEEYSCSCGVRIGKCSFWRDVKHSMKSRGQVFDVMHFDTRFDSTGSVLINRFRGALSAFPWLYVPANLLLRLCPGEERRLEMLVKRNSAFVESVLEVTGKRVFVDSSKDSLAVRTLVDRSSLQVRAIHLVRDVRGVVASRIRRNSGIDAAEAAQGWWRANLKKQAMLSALPEERRMRVRYEDLCRSPQRTMDRIFRFCGVDSIQLRNFRATPHHIVGNAMRLEQTSEISLDERWKTLLTARQLQQVNRVAGELNRKYGYQD